MLTPEVRQELLDAIQGIVQRIVNRGVNVEEVNALIHAYVNATLASEAEAATGDGDKLTTVRTSYLAAQKAIADWVGPDAPEALNTIRELAQAFKDNPDILDDIQLDVNNLRQTVIQNKEEAMTLITQVYTDLAAMFDNQTPT